jgi:hypothetical protein
MTDHNESLSDMDILRLSALKEVMGAFIHEMRQPLNAIMIASQVVQMRMERSNNLSDDEKGFVKHRLGLVTDQVHRLSDTLENVRLFASGKAHKHSSSLKDVFEKVLDLMGQQFVSRGITLTLDHIQESKFKIESEYWVEVILIQALAYARDSVGAIADRHEKKGIKYSRKLGLILTERNGSALFNAKWDIGEFPGRDELNFDRFPGLAGARSMLAESGGKLTFEEAGLTIRFPGQAETAGS